MTNFDNLYKNSKDFLIELLTNGRTLAVDRYSGEPRDCIGLPCNECKFHRSCASNRKEWLMQEIESDTSFESSNMKGEITW